MTLTVGELYDDFRRESHEAFLRLPADEQERIRAEKKEYEDAREKAIPIIRFLGNRATIDHCAHGTPLADSAWFRAWRHIAFQYPATY